MIAIEVIPILGGQIKKNTMPNSFRFLGFLFMVLFLCAVFLQYNDPDAVTWYLAYGIGAFASLLFGLGRLKLRWAVLLSGFYIVFSIMNWPEKFEGVVIGEGNIDAIEKGREALGLLISAGIMGIYALLIGKGKKD